MARHRVGTQFEMHDYKTCPVRNIRKVYCHGLAGVCAGCREMDGRPDAFGSFGQPLSLVELASVGSKWPLASNVMHHLQIDFLLENNESLGTYIELEVILEDIEKQLAVKMADEFMDTQAMPFPHPATHQKRLPEPFYRQSPTAVEWDSRRSRYQQALAENLYLPEPITYETLSQYQDRRKAILDPHDALYTEGKYWTWLMDVRNRNWLPADEEGSRQRSKHRRETPVFRLPQNHQWVEGNEFRVPQAWSDYEMKFPASFPTMRKLYLIAYSKAYWVHQPLPFETRVLFLARRARFDDMFVRMSESLDEIYTRWLNENRSMGIAESHQILDKYNTGMLETYQQGLN